MWAVLRARGRNAFEEVARVQAGAGLEMSWSDTSPPTGVVRYRIRRESLDARYRWESAEAWWPPQSRRPLVLARTGSSLLAFDRLELSGAESGLLDLRLYDIQGRLVLRQAAVADGSRRDSIQLELGSVQGAFGAGIYFAVVRDAAGIASNPLRLVLLR